MITEAAANPVSAGSDSVQPSISLDDAANLDIWEPDEANPDAEEEQQSEIETGETDDGQEAEATETAEDDDTAEAEDEGAEDTANPEPKDDVTVTVNGESVALSELKLGYMREKDYRHKTTDLGNRRRDLEALATSVTNSVNAIAQHLERTLPAAPDPNLALTNPNEYTRKKALHDHAMAQLAELLKTAHAPQQAVNKLTEQQHADLLRTETAKLAEAFPQVRTTEGHKQFFDAAAQTAKELGYGDDEIAQATDHRLFKLAHYARIGMQAEAAKAKAKQKVADVPPVAKPKRPVGADAGKRQRNVEAMKRLQRTGSIKDAMSIDFD